MSELLAAAHVVHSTSALDLRFFLFRWPWALGHVGCWVALAGSDCPNVDLAHSSLVHPHPVPCATLMILEVLICSSIL